MAIIRGVLAADCNCDSSDFDHDINTLTVVNQQHRCRRYFHVADPFIVTMGRGVVVSASQAHIDWFRQHIESLSRDDVFSAQTIACLTTYLEPFERIVHGPDLKYACAPDDLRTQSSKFDIAVLEDGELLDLYQYPGFNNALQYDSKHPQPDVLATAFRVDGRPAAIAGASADCDELWQIGIDVLPEHRSAGVGIALVTRLAREIFERGKVPYYSTSPSNIGSRRLARAVGFWPAWTEIRTSARPG